jgi:hypothetical protein
MPTEKKTQSSCPGGRDLNRSGKGLIILKVYTIECPFYPVPEHFSFIAYQACIRRDIP